MKKILLVTLIISFNLFTLNVFSQTHALYIKGAVTDIDDHNNVLDGIAAVGDSILATITYDLSATDENNLPSVGDYRYYTEPNGIVANINNYFFQTDMTNVDFLAEVTNDHSNSDNIVFRSYYNSFPDQLSDYTDNHISWQLDDATQTAVSDTELPLTIELSDWTQDFGFNITGETVDNEFEFSIKAVITFVDTVNIFSSVHESYADHVHIFPNPATNRITIQTTNNLHGDNYLLTDPLGRTIMTGPLNEHKTMLNISRLAEGLYFIKIGTDGKAYAIVKQ